MFFGRGSRRTITQRAHPVVRGFHPRRVALEHGSKPLEQLPPQRLFVGRTVLAALGLGKHRVIAVATDGGAPAHPATMERAGGAAARPRITAEAVNLFFQLGPEVAALLRIGEKERAQLRISPSRCFAS